jgi:hypothetical protein
MPSIRPPHPAILLAILIAGIGTGIPPATAADCNNNGIDDAVDIAGATSSDCNSDGRPDECGYAGVDLVAILDTSESVELESAAICAVLTPLADHLDSLGIDVTATILTINEPFSGFNCVDGTVLATLGGQVPGTGACGPITVDLLLRHRIVEHLYCCDRMNQYDNETGCAEAGCPGQGRLAASGGARGFARRAE